MWKFLATYGSWERAKPAFGSSNVSIPLPDGRFLFSLFSSSVSRAAIDLLPRYEFCLANVLVRNWSHVFCFFSPPVWNIPSWPSWCQGVNCLSCCRAIQACTTIRVISTESEKVFAQHATKDHCKIFVWCGIPYALRKRGLFVPRRPLQSLATDWRQHREAARLPPYSATKFLSFLLISNTHTYRLPIAKEAKSLRTCHGKSWYRGVDK